jgi:hypothetical protein
LRNKSGGPSPSQKETSAGIDNAKHEYQSISDDGDKNDANDDDDFFLAPPDLGPSLVK